MHKLLERQLRKYLPESWASKAELRDFIEAVNSSYQSFERDKSLNEHANKISEEEYIRTNQLLLAEVNHRRASVQQLKEAIESIQFNEIHVSESVPEFTDDSSSINQALQFLRTQLAARNKMEQELRSAEQQKEATVNQLSRLIASLHHGILVEDDQRRVVLVNQLFCDLFDLALSPSVMIGKDCDAMAAQAANLFADATGFLTRTNELVVERKLMTGELLELADGRIFQRDYVPVWVDGVFAGGLWKYENVTLAKEKERNLQLLSLVASAGSDGIVFTNAVGQVIWANQGFQRLTGYTEQEILGRTPIELCKGEKSDPQGLASMVAAFKAGVHFEVETPHYRKDGTWFWGRTKGESVRNEAGELTYYFARIEDVTTQREQAEQIRVLSLIAEDNNSAVVMTDPTGKITWVNNGFVRVTGYTLDEAAGQVPGHMLQGPGTDLATVDYLRKQIKNKQDFHCEILNYSKDNMPYWVRIAGQPLFDTAGKLTGFFAIEEDITEDKIREEEFHRLSIVASANSAGVAFFDTNDCFTWVNESYERITGYSREELIGRSPTSFMFGQQTNLESIVRIRELTEARKSFREEFLQYRKDGSAYWVRLSMQFVADELGSDIERFAVLEDISEEKDREQQFERLSLVASANNKGISIFDPEETYAWVNEAFVHLTGYSADDLLGYEQVNRFMGPETDPEVKARVTSNLIRQQEFTEEFLFYRQDGSTFWARMNRQFIFDKDGKLVQKFSVIEDITEEREIEMRLKESENRFRRSLQKIGDNVWEHNFVTDETWFSQEENDLLGYTTADYKRNHRLWWSSVYPADLHILQENDRRTQAGEIDHHILEYRMVHRDGSIRWVLDRGVIIERGPDNKPLRMIGTHTDITRIKQTEIELEQRMRQFKSLAENTPGVLVEYEYRKDGSEGYRYVSPSVERIIGLTPDEFFQHETYMHPDDRALNREKNLQSRETLEPFYNESRLIVPGRGIIWTSVTASFSYWTEEGSRVFTGFIMDITQKKQTEHFLRKEEEKYRSIIANMNLGLLEVNLQDEIIFANQSFCEMGGYDLRELLGKRAVDLFVVDQGKDVITERAKRRRDGHSDAYELMIRNKRGEAKWWLISGAPRYDDENELIGSIGIHLDITEQKQLEYDLILAREQAEASSKSKEAFLANMSHEIRTPMNAILGMAGQLKKTSLDDRQQFFLDNIHAASENLMIIINDILDLSKIEAGKLSLEYIGFEPKMVLNRLMQVLSHRAEEKGLKLMSSRCDSRLSPVLIGDPYRLNQILLNLASNSIKFTQRGYVDITFDMVEDTPRQQKVHISVRDTGIGMDADFVKNIFEKFTQEDASITRKFGGTGLGMSICKDLVTLMGGEIFVHSEKGLGTTMTIEITFEKGSIYDLPKTETIQFEPSMLRDKKVLVVDDNEINRLLASTILRNYQVNVREATNGLDALEKIQTDLPDLVLMDIQMPEMDGLEATRIIRRDISLDLPLIALTANAIKGDHERFLEAGMNDYLSKPFKEDDLLRIISTWLGNNTSGSNELLTAPRSHYIQSSIMHPRYSLSKLQEISRGNSAFVLKMLHLFLQQVPANVDAMVAAFEQGDLEQMGALAHRIKPTLDNLAIEEVREVIREIELAGKTGEKTERLNDQIAQVKEVISSVATLMQQDIDRFSQS